MTKTILVDVGRDKTHITITKNLGSKNSIISREIFTPSSEELANYIFDTYFSEGINEIYIDRNGVGRVVIESLVGKLKRAGYKYDYEKGTVQPVGKKLDKTLEITDNQGSIIFFTNGEVSIISNKNITIDMTKHNWDLTCGSSSEVSKIIDNKWEELKVTITKDEALRYLEKHNSLAARSDIITRLYFNDKSEYVQDFSRFTNDAFMSGELLTALKNGTTLSLKLESELDKFIIEKEYNKRELIQATSPVNNITINVSVATGKEFNAKELSEQLMVAIKRGRGIRN